LDFSVIGFIVLLFYDYFQHDAVRPVRMEDFSESDGALIYVAAALEKMQRYVYIKLNLPHSFHFS